MLKLNLRQAHKVNKRSKQSSWRWYYSNACPENNTQAGQGATGTPAQGTEAKPGNDQNAGTGQQTGTPAQGTETKPGNDQQGQGATGTGTPENTKPGENGAGTTVTPTPGENAGQTKPNGQENQENQVHLKPIKMLVLVNKLVRQTKITLETLQLNHLLLLIKVLKLNLILKLNLMQLHQTKMVLAHQEQDAGTKPGTTLTKHLVIQNNKVKAVLKQVQLHLNRVQHLIKTTKLVLVLL